MLNRVILIGRLGQDPELRHTQSGMAVATFNIAVDRPKTRSQREQNMPAETDWIRIVVWDKQAINCSQFLAKGRLVAVDGRLQINTWTDQQGQKRSAPEVVADTVRFLERGEGASNSQGAYSQPPQYGQPSGFGGGGFGGNYGSPNQGLGSGQGTGFGQGSSFGQGYGSPSGPGFGPGQGQPGGAGASSSGSLGSEIRFPDEGDDDLPF